MSWILRMAWRDTRGSRGRLSVFVMAMVVGVAALVAINSFGENLRKTVDAEAMTILGADLALETSRPPTEDVRAFVDSLGGEVSERISFSSMAIFSPTGDTRLVTVRALEGEYPYYGAIETRPSDAVDRFQEEPSALVDATVMQEYGLTVGDSVRIGGITYPIIGFLDRTPRESTAFMLASPRIYLGLEHLDLSLLGAGSRVTFEFYFRFDDGRNVDQFVADNRDRMRELNLRPETVADSRENWDEGLTNVYRFLSLVAFIAVLLGSLGVASAVHVFIRSRIDTVALLRCLGAPARKPLAVYLVQAVAMGFAGAVAGAILGSVVQLALPIVLSDFLPVAVGFGISWWSVAVGISAGLIVTLLFALLPLLDVRSIPPLRALRASVEGTNTRRWPSRVIVFLLLGAAVTGFAILQAPTPAFGIAYAAGVAIVFGMLALLAGTLMFVARKAFSPAWPYVIRQGVANLFRPNNQTLLLSLALGLGTFLILTLVLVQHTLVSQIRIAEAPDQPDLVFFDIQQDQIADVQERLADEGLPVIQSVPIITMRLQAINGRTIEELRQDTTRVGRASWALTREYRSSYRDRLTDSERVVRGSFTSHWDPEDGPAPISFEQDLAEELGVDVGDAVTFSVQGVTVETTVGSIRTVDWRRLSTNFFVVFPEGVINDAPRFYVVLTRAESDERSAAAQRAVVNAHPNVSAVDLKVVLSTFDAIFGRIATVLNFMGFFSILAGLLVLGGAVMVSRSRRTEETVLLKTLGASRSTVVRIMLVEYVALGVLAALTGILLAYGAGWSVSTYVFKTPFATSPESALAALLSVVGLAVLVGFLNSRGIYRRSPLEVLRTDV
jgi:putative ABC transport system permease protein